MFFSPRQGFFTLFLQCLPTDPFNTYNGVQGFRVKGIEKAQNKNILLVQTPAHQHIIYVMLASCNQFHQNFMGCFYADILSPKSCKAKL